MITHTDHSTTITCDKCGKQETAPIASYNEQFYKSRWGLYPRAKKYIHKCCDCMSAAHKRATDFVRRKFPIV